MWQSLQGGGRVWKLGAGAPKLKEVAKTMPDHKSMCGLVPQKLCQIWPELSQEFFEKKYNFLKVKLSKHCQKWNFGSYECIIKSNLIYVNMTQGPLLTQSMTKKPLIKMGTISNHSWTNRVKKRSSIPKNRSLATFSSVHSFLHAVEIFVSFVWNFVGDPENWKSWESPLESVLKKAKRVAHLHIQLKNAYNF